MQTTNLNPEQQAAVDSDAPRRLVLASPGAGKTRTLVAAVAREAREHGAAGCVVLSYTNAACDELRERLAALGVAGLGYVGTIHGFLFRMLQDWHGGWLAVIDDSQREAMVESIMQDMGVKTPIKKVMAHIERDLPVEPGVVSKETCVALEYELRMRSSGMVDFAGILARGLEAVRKLHEAGHWTYKALFTDEVQDSSRQDWCFFGTAPFERKYFTGDGDQAIYSFRGGRVDMLEKLAEHAGNPKAVGVRYELHLLETNYRCGSEICNRAQTLIEHNKSRVPKTTHPTPDTGHGRVEVIRYNNPQEELYGVACGVSWHMGEFNVDTSEIAILARTNRLAQSFAAHLKAGGCPVATVEQPQRPPDWRETKLLLTVLSNPFSDMTVLRLIEATECPQDAQRLREAAALRMVSVNELLGHRYGNACGSDLGIDGLKRLDQFGVSSESRELVHTACRELGKRGQWGLGDLIVYIGEQDACARTVGEGVRVSTIHSAKGTEASVVFVVGCEDGLLPSAKDAADPASLEESRRLLYVAATRAKRSLTLTWCCERAQFRGENIQPGPLETRRPSRFILEMGLTTN